MRLETYLLLVLDPPPHHLRYQIHGSNILQYVHGDQHDDFVLVLVDGGDDYDHLQQV